MAHQEGNIPFRITTYNDVETSEVRYLGAGRSEAPVLRCRKMSSIARYPEYGTAEAAGLDLFSARTVVIPAGERRLISTDIAWEIPGGCYVRIAPRSSLALVSYVRGG